MKLGCDTFQYSPLFFSVLRQITRVVASGGRSQQLRNELALIAEVSPAPFELGGRNAIEFLDAAETHRLHGLVWPLLEEWPERYVNHMKARGVWAAWATRDLREVPFKLRRVVDENLRLDIYSPPLPEVMAAVRVLSRRGLKISTRRVKALIGDSQLISTAIAAYDLRTLRRNWRGDRGDRPSKRQIRVR